MLSLQFAYNIFNFMFIKVPAAMLTGFNLLILLLFSIRKISPFQSAESSLNKLSMHTFIFNYLVLFTKVNVAKLTLVILLKMALANYNEIKCTQLKLHTKIINFFFCAPFLLPIIQFYDNVEGHLINTG